MQLSLKISGEFITKHARDLVIEGDWERAVKILGEDLIGSDYNIACEVLQCKKKFIGVNDLELVDDIPDDEYLELVHDIYGGLCKSGQYYWKCYAIVDGWFEGDIASKSMEANKFNYYSGPVPLYSSSNYTRFALARNTFYMDDREWDKAVFIENDVTLWKIVDKPPLWIKTYSRYEEAYKHYENLERRNGSQYMEKKEEPKLEPRSEDYFKNQEEEYKKDLIKIGENFSKQDNIKMQNGWLSPDGKFYSCMYSEHEITAAAICFNIHKSLPPNPGDVLIKLKWIKYQHGNFLNFGQTPSSKQIKAMSEYQKVNNLKQVNNFENLWN